MNMRMKDCFLILGQACVVSPHVAACTDGAAPESAQKAAQGKPQRVTVTGSDIADTAGGRRSVRLIVLNRGYIEQSGATSTVELIRTVSQTQNAVGAGQAPPQRH